MLETGRKRKVGSESLKWRGIKILEGLLGAASDYLKLQEFVGNLHWGLYTKRDLMGLQVPGRSCAVERMKKAGEAGLRKSFVEGAEMFFGLLSERHCLHPEDM